MRQAPPESLEQVLTILRTHLPELQVRYGVRSLAVFGSWVKREQGENSDLDLLIEFDRVLSLFGFLEVEETLEEWLGVPIDLVMKSALKPTIRKHVLQTVVRV